MRSARVRNTGSSFAWYFSQIAFTDSASMRACAGSYTPHGRSQCAETVTGAWRSFSRASTGPTFPFGRSSIGDTTPARRQHNRRDGGVGRWLRVRVQGRSMLPILAPGDRLLVWKGRLPRRSSDLVVVRLPERPLSVKRAGVRDERGWWVESANPAEGTDAWTLGAPVPPHDVVGVVVLRYRPLARAGVPRQPSGST